MKTRLKLAGLFLTSTIHRDPKAAIDDRVGDVFQWVQLADLLIETCQKNGPPDCSHPLPLLSRCVDCPAANLARNGGEINSGIGHWGITPSEARTLLQEPTLH